MIRLLIRTIVFLGSAAVGLLVAKALVEGFTISWGSFTVVVLVFAIVQSVLAPFIAKVATSNAPALLGASGLVSTFLALLAAWALFDGLTISGGASTWVYATVVVWIATMVATLVLPVLFVKRGVRKVRDARSAADSDDPPQGGRRTDRDSGSTA